MAEPPGRTDPWELCVPLTDVEMSVSPQLVSYLGIDPDFAAHNWLRDHRDLWSQLEPITIHREFNWRTNSPIKEWDRLYAGWVNGRHRVAIARDLGIAEIRITLLAFAF